MHGETRITKSIVVAKYARWLVVIQSYRIDKGR